MSNSQDINELTSRDAAWREALRNAMPARQRTAMPRTSMPEADPAERRHHMDMEVNRGLDHASAVAEASRCLDCPDPGCIKGCPVNIDIPAFIKNLQRGDVDGAARVLRLTSMLPSVCGRVCPQEKQCEHGCIYNKMHKAPVAIGWLERYAADNGHAPADHDHAPANGIKIAVVGSGPGGLSFAGSMAALGYDVTVFEALQDLGGVLRYGIPEFRLPNSVVDAEIDALRSAGVKFVTDTVIGKTLSYDDMLEQGFRGIFVASGAGLPRFMGIPGENLNGVMACNEYLTRINLMGAGRPGFATPVMHGKHVAVIGGGNTAMDAVRTALRMGAERAMIVYRRGLDEMPARAEEVKHAREEGVEFLTLHNPVAYHGDERGRVTSMTLQRMALGEPDASGRRSPVPVDGDTVEIPVDQVIVSVGVSPNPLIPNSIEGLEVTRRGTLVVDDDAQTTIPAIFAGGDIVRGGATVILAMGDGSQAAAHMHAHLSQSADHQ